MESNVDALGNCKPAFTVGSTQVFLSYHDANMYIGLETSPIAMDANKLKMRVVYIRCVFCLILALAMFGLVRGVRTWR